MYPVLLGLCIHPLLVLYSNLPHHVFGRLVILVTWSCTIVLPSTICYGPLIVVYSTEYLLLSQLNWLLLLQRSLDIVG